MERRSSIPGGQLSEVLYDSRVSMTDGQEDKCDVEAVAAADDPESEPPNTTRAALLASAQNVLIVLGGVRCLLAVAFV